MSGITEQLDFLQTLTPSDPSWGGTGSLRLHEDPRDFPMSLLPGFAEAPLAFPIDYSPLVQTIIDQGAEPSCVAFSTCGLAAAEEFAGDRTWETGDGHRFYRECGGTGANGIDTRLALDKARSEGVPLLSGSERTRIGAYLFATMSPGAFQADICQALSLGHLCTLALLLPSNFGWDSSGSITQSYHQVLVVGATGLADNDLVVICNSWSANWGNRGFGRIPWGFITQQNMQNKYAYSYAVTPFGISPTPTPTPIPVPVPVPTPAFVGISGKVSGANLSSVVVSDGYTLQGQGLTWPLTVTQVNGPLPNPIPDPLPIPTPTPDPGQISVKLNPAGIWLEVRLSDPATGSQLAGMVTATLNGAPYPVARPRTTPGVAALLRRPVAGAIITGKADDDRKGTATV